MALSASSSGFVIFCLTLAYVWMSSPAGFAQAKVPLYITRLRELLRRQKAFQEIQAARLQGLAQASTTFATQLFALQLSTGNHSNVVLSPLGAFASMAMMLSGSDGMTKAEVRHLLRMPDITGVHTTIQHAFTTFRHDDDDNGDSEDVVADDEGYARDSSKDFDDGDEEDGYDDDDDNIRRQYEKIVEMARSDLAVDSRISYTTGSTSIMPGIGISLSAGAKNAAEDGENGDGEGRQPKEDGRGRVTARFANGLFHSDDVAMTQQFSNRLADLYGAPPMALYPSDPTSSINLWVDASTRGAVPRMLDSPIVPENSSLFLVSAVFFRGSWQERFDDEKVAPVDFTTEVGDTVRIDTLHRIGNYSIKTPDGLGCRVLELPYAGGNYSLFVILPLPGRTLSQLEERVKSSDLLSLLGDMPEPGLTLLLLPKFRLRDRQSLRPAAQALGAMRLFKPWQAQLQRMTGEERSKLHVHDVIQYAALHVDEGGSQFHVGGGSPPADPSNPPAAVDTLSAFSDDDDDFDDDDEDDAYEPNGDEYYDRDDDYDGESEEGIDAEMNDFIVDRPFLFVVLDKRFHLVLLMGRVATPHL